MVPTESTIRRTVLEKNEKAKIYLGMYPLSFYKPDVIVHDKETNIWTVFEGTVCKVDKIAERFK